MMCFVFSSQISDHTTWEAPSRRTALKLNGISVKMNFAPAIWKNLKNLKKISKFENSRKKRLANYRYLAQTFKGVLSTFELESSSRNKSGHLPECIKNMTGGKTEVRRPAVSCKVLSV